MIKHLHIISFDIPYPPNYGGAIDVFYRLKTLHDKGVNIILHCFEYRTAIAPELNQYCQKVYYYKRNIGFKNQLNILPYTVLSRKNDELIKNLQLDEYPILFEGLMSCYYFNHPSLKSRLKFYREANIEHQYYYQLALASIKLSNKIYYFIEALKLFLFQEILSQSNLIIAISKTDEQYFKRKFPHKNVIFIPCFHANENVSSTEGSSDYILYHANLSVAENIKVAVYLVKKIFSKLQYTCVVAGMNPPDSLKKLILKYKNIKLIANPDESEMHHLIENAQIITLFTFQSTGMKIKLLHSLYRGRHLLVNELMLEGSGLDSLCHKSGSQIETIRLCHKLMSMTFTTDEILKRKEYLLPVFSNEYSGDLLIQSMESCIK